ncbi:MAG: hypothetical protein ACOC95_01865 [Planctomycetota bacterium]
MKRLILATIVATTTAIAMGGEVTVYTKDDAPAAPKPADLPLRTSVSQYGITWTFAEPARVGRFVNGDYYVVGPVTITGIDPAPRCGDAVRDDELDANERQWTANDSLKTADRVRNGSMLNPPAAQRVAYDSGIRNWFRPDLAARLPIKMTPGDSLVSTISMAVGEKVHPPYTGHRRGKVKYRGHADDSPVRTAAILTCMDAPQPADAFRPAYCDTTNKVYLARDLKRDLLRTLPRPKGVCHGPGYSAANHPPSDPPEAEHLPKVDFWVRVFQRPWINTGFFSFEQPLENMPHYEQWISQAMSMGGLMLMCDYTPAEKEPLLINMIQVGIDYWGAVNNGHPGWQGWGGHGSGRKFPIVFAGLLLGDVKMASPTKSFPTCNFGEDNQTMYGDCWTGAKVVFAGHSGVHNDGSVPREKWGPYEHLHPSKWDQGNRTSDAYRRANTSTSWVGQTLVLRLMDAEEAWGHDAFFDYVDRWMYEDATPFHREIDKHHGSNLAGPPAETGYWYRQGQAWEPFVTDLWHMYRTMEGMPPTDGWK